MKLTKKAALLSMGVATAVIASIGTVFAFGGHHHDPTKRADRIAEKMTKKLSLNVEQQDKLTIAKDAALHLHQKMHQDRQTLEEDILSLVSSETLDEALILEHINAKTDAIKAQAPEMVAALAGFYNSLDAKQQEKVRAKVERKMEHIRDDD
ncbi:MAG: Spy/CpxP family protein refolding chaperone [Cellvibrionaceae bacterium]